MPILKTSRLLPAMALFLGLVLSGCGDDGADRAAPRNAGDGGTSQGEDQGVKYAQCMRENGVPDFPDPVDGRFTIKRGPGEGGAMEGSAFDAAQKKCQDLAPGGTGPDGGDPKMQEQMLKYVSCMRENGVPNFPDPDGGRIRISPDMGFDPESPAFKQAEEACKARMPGGGS
ncbi:hypothetical protein [Actinocorallia populi]|uniref:hypothetical protein n=1 Tax=Actinocorallia populi TaxID=2079200 RepID=UPI000D086684|nr:hypothetical protein [Actinocorallia populi]